MGFIILLLFGIAVVALIIWVLINTWNDRGIIGELEEANRLKRLELNHKNNNEEMIEKIRQIDEEMYKKIGNDKLVEEFRKIDEEKYENLRKINT
jgi:hypothetical protein